MAICSKYTHSTCYCIIVCNNIPSWQSNNLIEVGFELLGFLTLCLSVLTANAIKLR